MHISSQSTYDNVIIAWMPHNLENAVDRVRDQTHPSAPNLLPNNTPPVPVPQTAANELFM